jgi:hypothetical protein
MTNISAEGGIHKLLIYLYPKSPRSTLDTAEICQDRFGINLFIQVARTDKDIGDERRLKSVHELGKRML